MFCLELNSSISLEEAWQQLEAKGLGIAYGEEESGCSKIYVFEKTASLFEGFSWIEQYYPFELPSIDWKAQWETHGMNFSEGCVHVDLSQFGAKSSLSLKLKPGPGFGDLSHPTTRLVLRLLSKYLNGQSLVDVGCGSGILSLAAAAMQSPRVYGIDIDPAALKHSKKNAMLNHLEKNCQFKNPTQLKKLDASQEWLICMNMIASEQEMAWASLPLLHTLPGLRLTSGIRQEDRLHYLTQTAKWGWRLIEEVVEEEWVGFCFKQA